MERLTERYVPNDEKKGITGIKVFEFENKIPLVKVLSGEYLYPAIEKLATYEDLEEQGLLVRLPCKVGATVWELCLCDDGNYKIFPMIVKTISEYGTLRQVEKDITIWNIYAESDYTYMYKSFADFGKTVFSTKEEAKKKLEEMKK